MFIRRMRFVLARIFLAGALVFSTEGRGLSAQTAATRSSPADDPDVQGAERLFWHGSKARLRIADCRVLS